LFEVQQTARFAAWLARLRDSRAKAVIARRIQRMASGNFGDAQAVGGQVSELRVDFGPGYRVYFTRRGTEIVILLCGGDKSSQRRDIALAKTMAAEVHGGN
jgi:putative addiction module killer protein